MNTFGGNVVKFVAKLLIIKIVKIYSLLILFPFFLSKLTDKILAEFCFADGRMDDAVGEAAHPGLISEERLHLLQSDRLEGHLLVELQQLWGYMLGAKTSNVN